jgi:hypothetical protein
MSQAQNASVVELNARQSISRDGGAYLWEFSSASPPVFARGQHPERSLARKPCELSVEYLSQTTCCTMAYDKGLHRYTIENEQRQVLCTVAKQRYRLLKSIYKVDTFTDDNSGELIVNRSPATVLLPSLYSRMFARLELGGGDVASFVLAGRWSGFDGSLSLTGQSLSIMQLALVGVACWIVIGLDCLTTDDLSF